MSSKNDKENKSTSQQKITFEDIDSMFDEDIEEYNTQLETLKELFTEFKSYYDDVKKKSTKGGSGSFNFLMTQTENLIKLMETETKVTDKRMSAKQAKTNFKMQILRLRDTDDDQDKYIKTAKKLHKLLLADNKSKEAKPILTQFDEDEIKNNPEEDEKILLERIEEIKIKKEQNKPEYEREAEEVDLSSVTQEVIVEEIEIPEEDIEEEATLDFSGVRFVTNHEGTVIAVDNDYNELTDVTIPEIYKNIIFDIDEEDQIVAKTTDGEIIEIVEF